MTTGQSRERGTASAAGGVAGPATEAGAAGGVEHATTEAAGAIGEISAEDLQRMVRALGLVAIPERLLPKVLEHVRSHREAMAKFDAAGIDLANVITAQPFRA